METSAMHAKSDIPTTFMPKLLQKFQMNGYTMGYIYTMEYFSTIKK